MKVTRVRITNFYNLKDVDLDLTQGQALIVGPNGSGKSNIIKCIEFLVDRMLGRDPPSGDIWDVNAREAYIKVNAVFAKEELEFFSNLRVFFLLCDVSEMVNFICATVRSLVISAVHEGSTIASAEELADELQRWSYRIFHDFPKETLTSLFEAEYFGMKNRRGGYVIDFHYPGGLDNVPACVESLSLTTVETLFPKLLKKTREAVASERTRPGNDSDLLMSVHNDTGIPDELESCCEIEDGLWLPTSLEEESDVIGEVVRNIFGELEGIEIFVEGHAEPQTSLSSVISSFVKHQRFDSPSLRQESPHRQQPIHFESSHQFFIRKLSGKLPRVMKWLKSWMDRRCTVNWMDSVTSKRTCVDIVARTFLESSLCVLPQNRGLLRSGSAYLNLNETEHMLTRASQSRDDHERERYKDVLEKLKHFCGLEIDVYDKPHHSRNLKKSESEREETDEDETKESEKERLPIDFGYAIRQTNKGSAYDTPHAVSSTNHRQVMAKFTKRSGQQHQTFKIPLSGLSGGQVELVMVFCAVHLSGADNVLLDEPGHSLHPPMQAQLRRWLETQRPPGQTCVVVSHSVEFISPESLRCLYHMSPAGTGVGGPGITDDVDTTASDERAPENDPEANQPQNQGTAEGEQPPQESDQPDIRAKGGKTASDGRAPENDPEANQPQNQGTAEGEQPPQESDQPDIRAKGGKTASDGRALSPAPENDPEANQPQNQGTAEGEQPPQESDQPDIRAKGGKTASDGRALSPAPQNDQEANQPQRQAAADREQQESEPDNASTTAVTSRRLHIEQSRQSSEHSVHLSQTIITMLMRPDMRKMFFATGLYLVEGPADKRVLSAMRHVLMEDAGKVLEKSKDPRELNQAMKVQEMDRWDILELGGCGDAVKAYKAAASLKIPCAVVLDFDAMTVKHGTTVQAFNRANWEKSRLYKALTSEQESFPLAGTLLEEVEKISSQENTDDKISERACQVMDKYGFFIWEIDLEAAIFSPQTRKNILETENFLDIVGVQRHCASSHDRRKPMSIDVAQENYDLKVLAVYRPMIGDLVSELEGAREKIAEGESPVPVTPVTDKVLKVITLINQTKQVLSQYDKFVEKGTKRTEGARQSRTGAEHGASSATQQVDTKEDQTAETDEERERREDFFWYQIKQKLHDGGWARMPWETLLEVLRVCLQDKHSPLAKLCRFMKSHQIRGKKRRQELPRNLISRMFEETDDSDVDVWT